MKALHGLALLVGLASCNSILGIQDLSGGGEFDASTDGSGDDGDAGDLDAGNVDAPTGVCVGLDAPDPTCPADSPICVDGACGGDCAADADCAGRPASESVCHVPSGVCVACDEDDRQAPPGGAEDECPSAANSVCDAITHTCRPCQLPAECVSGVCEGGACAP